MKQLELIKIIINRIAKEYRCVIFLQKKLNESALEKYIKQRSASLALYSIYNSISEIRIFLRSQKGISVNKAFNRMLTAFLSQNIKAFIINNELDNKLINACKCYDINANNIDQYLDYILKEAINPYYILDIWYNTLIEYKDRRSFFSTQDKYKTYITKKFQLTNYMTYNQME